MNKNSLNTDRPSSPQVFQEASCFHLSMEWMPLGLDMKLVEKSTLKIHQLVGHGDAGEKAGWRSTSRQSTAYA